VKGSIAAAFVVLALTLLAFAKKEPKEYPLSGTVVSFHAEKEVSGTDGDIDTYSRRVYVLKTDTSELEITGWDSQRHAPFTKSKAQKRPPLSIGQKITYRTEREVYLDGARRWYGAPLLHQLGEVSLCQLFFRASRFVPCARSADSICSMSRSISRTYASPV
jgi:hypothetical protein